MWLRLYLIQKQRWHSSSLVHTSQDWWVSGDPWAQGAGLETWVSWLHAFQGDITSRKPIFELMHMSSIICSAVRMIGRVQIWSALPGPGLPWVLLNLYEKMPHCHYLDRNMLSGTYRLQYLFGKEITPCKLCRNKGHENFAAGWHHYRMTDIDYGRI
jgi:hypothetical protein